MNKKVLWLGVLLYGFSIPASAQSPTRTVKGGALDEIKLYADRPSSSTRAVIRLFSATDDDLTKGDKKDETKTMQADGPGILAERFVARLKEIGPFSDVSIIQPGDRAPEGAVVVEGKFTELDPGSAAKRAFVGFGAGKSGVSVEGSVKASDGMLLATFEQRRISTMGAGGSLGKLQGDTKSIGEDIAKFLSAWATGKSLK